MSEGKIKVLSLQSKGGEKSLQDSLLVRNMGDNQGSDAIYFNYNEVKT